MPTNPFRNFLAAHLLLTLVRASPRLNTKASLKQNLETLLRCAGDSNTLKQALFFVALPRTYALWRRRYPKSTLCPAVLSSPLLYLVDPALRRTLVVYVATAAALNFKRDSKQRLLLPPAWSLILPANSWLLYAFIFKPQCFPRGYGNFILSHSGYASGESTPQLIQFLQQTNFEIYPPGKLTLSQSHPTSTPIIHPNHTRIVCARLHPDTPSCLEAYITSWISQFPKVFRWVGAFGALPLLFKIQKIRNSPYRAFKHWVISSLRGTTFVVGTINTCWALTCLLQRLLPPGAFPHLRWIANGVLGNLWVLVLPAKRRSDFALYTTRLSIVSCWNLFNNSSPRHGEILVLAIAWWSLLRDRHDGKGPLGFAGFLLDYIDSHAQGS